MSWGHMSMHVCTALGTAATGSWIGLHGWGGRRAHWVLGLSMESAVSRAATCLPVTMIRSHTPETCTQAEIAVTLCCSTPPIDLPAETMSAALG